MDNAALFASPADWISPNAEGGYKENPPAADGSKVIITDTDHLWSVGGTYKWVWKSFCRGLNPIYMDRLAADPRSAAVRKAMGDTLAYAARLPLAAMLPRPDLASTGYCLAKPGAAYVVYLPIDPQRQRPTVTVALSAAVGDLGVEWFNPRTGATMAGGGVIALFPRRYAACCPGSTCALSS